MVPSVDTDEVDLNQYSELLRALVSCFSSEMKRSDFEVEHLRVFRPLPRRHEELRNGSRISISEAQDLLVQMVLEDTLGPYCDLVLGQDSRVCISWDMAIYLYAPTEVADVLSARTAQEPVELYRRSVTAVMRETVENPVTRAADDEFWRQLRGLQGDVKILCERWADGPAGFRWYRVNDDNFDLITRSIEVRSLVFVVVDPVLDLSEEVIDESFTAFRSPLAPGRLDYERFGFADSIDDVHQLGFDLALPDSSWGNMCAVKPDGDGMIRIEWDW